MATTNEYVLARADHPSLFNFYPSLDAAERDWARANEYAQSETPPFWYEPMTFDAYLDAERDYWLSQPERAIDRAEYVRMLEILPPMEWEMTDTYSRFLMSEMTSGPYTEQYIWRKGPDGGTYAVKMVSIHERSTWMS